MKFPEKEDFLKLMSPIAKKYRLVPIPRWNDQGEVRYGFSNNLSDWIGVSHPIEWGGALVYYHRKTEDDEFPNEISVYMNEVYRREKIQISKVKDLDDLKSKVLTLVMKSYASISHSKETRTYNQVACDMIVPKSAKFIMYKKVGYGGKYRRECSNTGWYEERYKKYAIAKLEVAENVKRMQTVSHHKQVRVAEAKVIGFEDLEGNPLNIRVAHSPKMLLNDVEYRPGQIVKADCWTDTQEFATHGIHGFVQKKDAVKKQY